MRITECYSTFENSTTRRRDDLEPQKISRASNPFYMAGVIRTRTYDSTEAMPTTQGRFIHWALGEGAQEPGAWKSWI
ncbi:hypothetical protein TNCV_2705011 [Trichonephila clavipes]|nr:hypothetical protein TNCV_2705011 [Trichonephila clavipes]